MRTVTLALLLAVASMSMSLSATTTATAGGKHGTPHCPAGTKMVTDNVTHEILCQHPPVDGLTGHPTYDVKATCTLGETRVIKVDLPGGGHRDVRQTCTNNF